MEDRVYPTAKTNGTADTNKTVKNGAANTPSFPATKSQLYNPNRHPYRPQPNTQRRRSRSGRSCICLCCFWSVLLLTAFLLLAAIAGCVVYVLYSPKRPAFSVTALRISQFNLTTSPADDSTHLTSSFNLTISAKNPNKKLIYDYDPISISAVESNGVEIGHGSFPSFTSDPQNLTIIRSVLSESSEAVDADSATSLRSDLKKKIGLPQKIVMDTKVVVHVGKMKGKKLGIRVTCDGIRGVVVPKGKSPSIASTADAKCEVDLRIKIWKWTF